MFRAWLDRRRYKPENDLGFVFFVLVALFLTAIVFGWWDWP